MTLNPTLLATKVCERCHTTFTPRFHATSKRWARIRFCSKSCGKQQSVTVICQHCQKPYLKKPSALWYAKYCSKRCDSAAKRARYVGKKNPNWRHGAKAASLTKAVKGPGNKLYIKGRRLERRATDALEADGYYVVRSGGSRGVWDLVGIGPTDVRLVQVKANGNATPAERLRIAAAVAPANARKQIWIYIDNQRGGPTIIDIVDEASARERRWRPRIVEVHAADLEQQQEAAP